MRTPSEKYSPAELDSVLSDEGPMPAARLPIRLQAFVIDWVFVSILASIIIWKFAMPQAFPEAYPELSAWSNDFVEWSFSLFGGPSNETPMPVRDESLNEAIVYAQLLVLLSFFAYFTVSEAFFSGYTFGKSICRLRTISIVTMKKPFFFSVTARAGLKTLAISYPLILLATMIVLRFNKRRQMGHDILCHTAVVDERYLSVVDQIR